MTFRPIYCRMLPLAASAMLVACGPQESPSTADVNEKSEPNAELQTAAREVREQMPVAGIEMPYGELDDELLRGHFVYPQAMVEPLPAIIMIHEWWGLNDSVKQAAELLAAQGYMVLAVDLFGGEVATSVAEAGELSRTLLEETEQADANLQAAHEFLTEVAGAPRVAAIGWSMGGYWALKSMRLMPEELSAAVVFYSQVDEDDEKIATLDAPVLGLFAGSDRSIPAQTVRDFRARAKQLERDVEIFIFPNVDHGFANPDDNAYDAVAAEDAWSRAFSFLDQHLRPD